MVFKLLIEFSSIAPKSEKSNHDEMEVLMTMLAGLAAPVEASSSPLKSKRLMRRGYKQPPRCVLFSCRISFNRAVTLSTLSISN